MNTIILLLVGATVVVGILELMGKCPHGVGTILAGLTIGVAVLH